jgi:hypothetical protein
MPLTDPIPLTDTNWPIALLPVRLETRLMGVAGATELWIRVYPVAVHTDAHEPELTADERSWGDTFWRERASTTEPVWRASWARLVGRFGAARAAWIARLRNPANTVDADRKDLARDASWTRGAHTTVLPHRWVALGYSIAAATTTTPRTVQRIFEAWGAPIPDQVRVGPSPRVAPSAPAGELALEPELRWMVDFETARTQGMALKVPLAAPYSAGFDRLIVIGVKQSIAGKSITTPAQLASESAARLEQLLDAHHYTHGLGFVTPGTPTNNTAAAASIEV